jgi:hypothetical protein
MKNIRQKIEEKKYEAVLKKVLDNDINLTKVYFCGDWHGWRGIITDVLAIKIASALTSNTTVTEIFLSSNTISDIGASAFASSLTKNATLTSLDLGNNQIGDAGAQELAQALLKNNTLISLDLNANQTRHAVKTQVDSLIKHNQQYLKNLQAAACKQVNIGRILLYKAETTISGCNFYLELPLEIKEKIISYVSKNIYFTKEQQRLVLNYAEGEITPLADKLSFFKATKCDRIRKQLKQDEIEAASCSHPSIV